MKLPTMAQRCAKLHPMSLGADPVAHLLEIRQALGWRGDAFRQLRADRRVEALEAGIADMQADADRARRIGHDHQAVELLTTVEQMRDAVVRLLSRGVESLTAIVAVYHFMLDRIAVALAMPPMEPIGSIDTEPPPPPRLPDVASLVSAARPGPAAGIAHAA